MFLQMGFPAYYKFLFFTNNFAEWAVVVVVVRIRTPIYGVVERVRSPFDHRHGPYFWTMLFT